MSTLPYHDTKPQGAADFYYAINATFNFIEENLGREALVQYWEAMGRDYFKPVAKLWAEGGLAAVETYWRDFFAAEPGSSIELEREPEKVLLKVKTCPAIAHLQKSGRRINESYCQHCYHVSRAIGEAAGVRVRIQGGAGACEQHFYGPGVVPDRDNAIKANS